MGHPDGAGTAARAREPCQLGSGGFHSLAGDSSLWGVPHPHSHKPQTNRPSSQEVFKKFVCLL